MKTVSVATIRELDRRAIDESGIPGENMMELAGYGAAEAVIEFAGSLEERHARRFVIITGRGNNGGDGFVVARLLHQWGRVVDLISIVPFDELAGDAELNYLRLPDAVEREFHPEPDPSLFQPFDIIIDALLGTGAKGAPRPPFDGWINFMNKIGLPVVALDIPSGLNGDDGSVAGVAVKADLTVSFGLPQPGLVINEGTKLCGHLRMVDISLPLEIIAEAESSGFETIFAEDIRPALGRVPADRHKVSAGRVLVVGGDAGYPGAPMLAAKGAVRCGAGLVTVATPAAANAVPGWDSLIHRRVPDGGKGFFNADSINSVMTLAANADAIVIGPGMGRHPDSTALLSELIKLDQPKIIDADALNLMADNPELASGLDSSIITPHPGEAKRLLKALGREKDIDQPRIERARVLAAATGAVTVLKGRNTVIASPCGTVKVNSSGDQALATAGSGDVLAGAIAAFAATGLPLLKAAETAVFIHGLAGELSPFGHRGLGADDLIDLLPKAIRTISPFA